MDINSTEISINGKMVQTIEARLLHRVMNVGRKPSTWITGRISELGFVEGVDYVKGPQMGTYSTRGQPRIEYHLTLDAAMHIAMLERSDEGFAIRQRLIDMRNALLAQQVSAVPLTRTELAEMVIQAEAENAQQAARIERLEPKAEIYDRFLDANGFVGLQDAMRAINVAPNKAIAWLKSKGVLFEKDGNSNTPKAQYIERAYFFVKRRKLKDSGKWRSQTMVTHKGLAWFAKTIPDDLRHKPALIRGEAKQITGPKAPTEIA